jgi:glutamine amidotransferase
LSVDFAQETTPNDIVTVIATRPLTRNETWTVMEPGTMTVFREGLVVVR